MQQLDEVISYNNAICASEKQEEEEEEELGCDYKLCNMCDAIFYENKTVFFDNKFSKIFFQQS